jgi:ZIP family zinc transporter
VFAGLATGIGSIIALFCHHTNKKFLSASLGFSAGVMIYVSFVEILQKARDSLIEVKGEVMGNWLTAISFFGGIVVILLIDILIPSYENPHEPHIVEEMDSKKMHGPKLMRMGIFTALAIAIHNFPEGLATFTAALTEPTIGISIAIAIAIHNIPEGISVAVPIHAATGSRKKAFWYSFLSGVSEPVGAAIGYLILMPFFSPVTFGILFASVAGIMVFVSLDELIPTAKEYGTGHIAIYGIIAGMAVMALSLLLFM